MSFGVGHRYGSDLVWLWLWRRPAAVALSLPLAWEFPQPLGAALKTKKKKKKKKALEPGCPRSSASCLYHVSLGKFLNLSLHQYPHLKVGITRTTQSCSDSYCLMISSRDNIGKVLSIQ